MLAFGSIVLTCFPFTDLLAPSDDRPSWSRATISAGAILIVCFIASMARTGPDMAPLAPLL